MLVRGVVGMLLGVLTLWHLPATAVEPRTTSASTLVMASVTAPTARATTAERRRPALRVGVSPGGPIFDAPDKQLRKDLRDMRRAGVRQIRLDLSWPRAQPRRNRLDWSDYDRVIGAARKQKLRVLLVVGYKPGWASKANGEVKPHLFARFAGKAARRYRSKVHLWELWNEPNLQFYWTARPNPRVYAKLVNKASRAIRKNDRTSKILVGALAPAVDSRNGDSIAPETFLNRMYRNGVRKSAFDGVSVHPYSYPAFPDQGQDWNTFHRLPEIHGVMRRRGDGRKMLWLTEFGAPTGTSGVAVSERRQANMIKRGLAEARRLRFVRNIFVYSWRDDGRRKRVAEDNFGMVRKGGARKPAYWALRRELRRR